jgi:hypothetical protein
MGPTRTHNVTRDSVHLINPPISVDADPDKQVGHHMVRQNGSERHTVDLPYHIGVRWESTERFGTGTL